MGGEKPQSGPQHHLMGKKTVGHWEVRHNGEKGGVKKKRFLVPKPEWQRMAESLQNSVQRIRREKSEHRGGFFFDDRKGNGELKIRSRSPAVCVGGGAKAVKNMVTKRERHLYELGRIVKAQDRPRTRTMGIRAGKGRYSRRKNQRGNGKRFRVFVGRCGEKRLEKANVRDTKNRGDQKGKATLFSKDDH